MRPTDGQSTGRHWPARHAHCQPALVQSVASGELFDEFYLPTPLTDFQLSRPAHLYVVLASNISYTSARSRLGPYRKSARRRRRRGTV